MPFPIFKQLLEDDYEDPELMAAEGLIRKDDRVLELGTGLGIVSALISRMAPGIAIHSFEGNPSLLPHITQLHQCNGINSVRVTNAILEPHPSSNVRNFHIHKYFSEGSIYKSKLSNSIIEVPVVDIDILMRDFMPTILICDIEGAEELVIPDCDLSTLRGIVLELHPNLVSQAGVNRIYDALSSARLYPNTELSSKQVVAFERIDDC